MILDQRHIYPGAHLTTVAEVRSMWADILAARSAAEGRSITPWRTGRAATAYVNWGRWVIDCDECGDGPSAWPDHDEACCMGCGAVVDVEFPDPETREKAEAVLGARTRFANRSWYPDRETLEDLQAESILMGDVAEHLPELAGIAGPNGRLGPDELIPEFAERYEALQLQRHVRALERGRS